MQNQQARDEAGNIWEIDAQGNPVRLVQPARAPGARMVAPNPGYEAEQRKDAAQLDATQVGAARTRQQMTIDAAQAPYAGPLAAAQAAKAQAEAEQARRNLAAQQATANPQQQRAMADLANDEVLTAIGKARDRLNGGMAAGYVARLPEMLQPQNAIDLGGALNTIASRLTLDKLAQLKQASPTGASGLGSLTEKEGALLRDSVAALGQTQSPDVLRENLAAVERHYRNMLAMSAGEDYRDPKVAEKYGIVAMPDSKSAYDGRTGGDDSRINPSLAPAGAQYREEPDPALRGVNARVRAMVGAGRSPAEIRDYLNKVSPGLGDRNDASAKAAVAFRAQNPNVPLDQYVISLENRQIPMGGARSFLNAAAQSPVGAGTLGAFDALTAFNAHKFAGSPELARAGMNQIAQDNPVSSTVGTLGGGALAGAGIEAALPARLVGTGAGVLAPRLLASDAIYGGAAGYGNSDGSLGGTVKGALEGVVGGGIGRGALRGVGTTMRGVTNPDVQLLRDRGVPLTVGQMAGGRLARREDRLAGYAGVGDNINDLRRGGLREFNRAAFQEGLEPIGQVGAGNIAEQGIDEARQSVSGAYRQALSGVQATADPQFIAETQQALARGSAIPRTGQEFQHVVNTRVAPMFNAGNGSITGPQMQDALQGIRGADFGSDAMGHDAAAALGGVEDAITGLVQRQAPDVMPQYEAANRAYRNTSILADAVGRGMNTEGVFTPAQLGMAARANATKYQGKMGAASTNRPFYDLQRAAQNVLPSKVPDSGTAGRIQAGKGIFGAAQNMARSAVNAPLYSEATQPLIAQMLLERPDVIRQLGEQLNRRTRYGGLFGAPLAVESGVVQDY